MNETNLKGKDDLEVNAEESEQNNFLQLLQTKLKLRDFRSAKHRSAGISTRLNAGLRQGSGAGGGPFCEIPQALKAMHRNAAQGVATLSGGTYMLFNDRKDHQRANRCGTAGIG